MRSPPEKTGEVLGMKAEGLTKTSTSFGPMLLRSSCDEVGPFRASGR